MVIKKKKVTKKELVKHLKGDIKGYKEEAKEDMALIKRIKAKKTAPKKKKATPKKASTIKKTVQVAKGVRLKRGVEEKLSKKKGSSNVGKYKNVSPSDFAGAAGGASKYSFPINTLARARNALARAHFAPDPTGIKKKVYSKYPELKKKAAERKPVRRKK